MHRSYKVFSYEILQVLLIVVLLFSAGCSGLWEVLFCSRDMKPRENGGPPPRLEKEIGLGDFEVVCKTNYCKYLEISFRSWPNEIGSNVLTNIVRLYEEGAHGIAVEGFITEVVEKESITVEIIKDYVDFRRRVIDKKTQQFESMTISTETYEEASDDPRPP